MDAGRRRGVGYVIDRLDVRNAVHEEVVLEHPAVGDGAKAVVERQRLRGEVELQQVVARRRGWEGERLMLRAEDGVEAHAVPVSDEGGKGSQGRRGRRERKRGHAFEDLACPRANFMNLEALRHGKSIFEMIAICHGENSFQIGVRSPSAFPARTRKKETGRTLFDQRTAIFREYIVI